MEHFSSVHGFRKGLQHQSLPYIYYTAAMRKDKALCLQYAEPAHDSQKTPT